MWPIARQNFLPFEVTLLAHIFVYVYDDDAIFFLYSSQVLCGFCRFISDFLPLITSSHFYP